MSRLTSDHASTQLAPADSAAAPHAVTADRADRGTAVPRHRAWPEWLPPVVAVLAGLVSGGYRLGVPSPWRDEAATVDAAQRPVAQIFALLGHVDAVNGAYYLCLHPVIAVLGSSPAVYPGTVGAGDGGRGGFHGGPGPAAGGHGRPCSQRSPACSPGCCWWPRRRSPGTRRTPGPMRSWPCWPRPPPTCWSARWPTAGGGGGPVTAPRSLPPGCSTCSRCCLSSRTGCPCSPCGPAALPAACPACSWPGGRWRPPRPRRRSRRCWCWATASARRSGG